MRGILKDSQEQILKRQRSQKNLNLTFFLPASSAGKPFLITDGSFADMTPR